jgi:CRISPR-associated protein Cas1
VGYRNILVENELNISVKNEQLLFTNNTSIPLEDINCIVIENLHSVLSTFCFNKFSEYNIAVFFCNQKHIPSSVVLPLAAHYKHFSMLKQQINISKPLQKSLWQQIIKQKILNQALCLSRCGIKSDYLLNIEKCVLSGDSSNAEAAAASFYFRKLYGLEFKRRSGGYLNSALNYGYAIIRGLISRSIIAHGFEPSIGLFHKSELNSFNLSDDFIEPFRPFVDYYVTAKLNIINQDEFGPSDKRTIFNMLSYCIQTDDTDNTIANAVDMLVCSFARTLDRQSKNLILPQLTDLRQYEYK